MKKACLLFIPIMICCVAISTISFAQTRDTKPPSRENACEEANLTGNLLGLCRAYWEANDCDVISSPKNKKQCEAIERNFTRLSGGRDIKEIFQSSGSAVIGAAGGEVNLDGVAKVLFPSGAFPSDTRVTITTSSSPEVANAFNNFTGVFRPANRLGYEVRINTGALPPISDTVHVEIVVPASFLSAVPPDHQIELFAQLLSDGGEETIDLFELFDATSDALVTIISADLPGAVFSNTRNSLGQYEAIVTLAPTPGINRTLSTSSTLSSRSALSSLAISASSECKAASIKCPLGIGCEVTSPFDPARKHPITGVVRPHAGVDYRAPNGTDVLAASDGKVETSRITSGYGETIVVRHTDGSATLYAHLEQRNVAVGTPVTKGQVIATSDNTGTSTGPHLHFEYVPNGQIFKSKNRIDPDPCVDTLATGSITVRDNGNLADDAFQVFLDNILIGSTSIGASNTLAVNNLKSGNHQLRITAIIAPDNVGTFEISLSDGLTFLGGGTLVSGVIAQGASANFTIVVP